MTLEESYVNERLDHLDIVAGVCQEIGLAAWLDTQEPGKRQQGSVGTATVALFLPFYGKLPSRLKKTWCRRISDATF